MTPQSFHYNLKWHKTVETEDIFRKKVTKLGLIVKYIYFYI